MSRLRFVSSIRLLSLIAFISLFIVPPLFGGGPNNCVAVSGIAQEHLLDFGNPDWEGGRPGDPWVGPVQLVAGDEILIGKISENDGDPGPSNGTGQGRGGAYFFDFGTQGSFIVEYNNAEWPTMPKFPNFAAGKFRSQGSVNVTNGLGRFTKTTGNIMTDGAFVAWNLDQLIPSGRFNNTITGKLCNVDPKVE